MTEVTEAYVFYYVENGEAVPVMFDGKPVATTDGKQIAEFLNRARRLAPGKEIAVLWYRRDEAVQKFRPPLAW
jgi:hypothetical protein